MNCETLKWNQTALFRWLIVFLFFFCPSLALFSTTARHNQPDKPCEEPCCRVRDGKIEYYCEVRSIFYYAKCILHCYRYQYAFGTSNDNQGDISDETLLDKWAECGTYEFSIPCCILLRYRASGSICEYQDACDTEAETYFKSALGGCETFSQCLPTSYEYFYWDNCEIVFTIGKIRR